MRSTTRGFLIDLAALLALALPVALLLDTLVTVLRGLDDSSLLTSRIADDGVVTYLVLVGPFALGCVIYLLLVAAAARKWPGKARIAAIALAPVAIVVLNALAFRSIMGYWQLTLVLAAVLCTYGLIARTPRRSFS